MLLRVQPCDFKLHYIPGKNIALADTMSRQSSAEAKQIELDVQVSFVQFSTKKLEAVREATRTDDELCALKAIIINGWPENQRHLAAPL